MTAYPKKTGNNKTGKRKRLERIYRTLADMSDKKKRSHGQAGTNLIFVLLLRDPLIRKSRNEWYVS